MPGFASDRARLHSAAGIFIYSQNKTVWAEDFITPGTACLEAADFCRRPRNASASFWGGRLPATKDHLTMMMKTATLTACFPLVRGGTKDFTSVTSFNLQEVLL